jgi:hypothetical protein
VNPLPRGSRARSVFVTSAGLLLAVAQLADAQQLVPPSYAEYRADAIVGRGTSLHAGGGAVVPLGVYVRFNIDGAAGATWRNGATNVSGRLDAIGRFLLDPYREVPVGLSLGGGLSVPVAKGDVRVRPYLTAVVDMEGHMHGPISPAIQVGLGGGARLGLVLRTSPARWR